MGASLETQLEVGRVRGHVLEPGDDGYDDAGRIWNAMVDKRPAVIVRCRGAADVIRAVNHALFRMNMNVAPGR